VDQFKGDGSFKGPCPGGWPYQGSYGNEYGRIRSAAVFAPPLVCSPSSRSRASEPPCPAWKDGQETLTEARAKVYVTSHDGYLHCVDLASPNSKSTSLRLQGHTWSEPVVVVNSQKKVLVMVSDAAGYLTVVDGETCKSIGSTLVNDAADLYDDSWPLVAILCATLIPLFIIGGIVGYLLRKRCRLQQEAEDMIVQDRQEEQDERESQALIRESSQGGSGSFRPQGPRADDSIGRPNGIDEVRGSGGQYRAPGGTGASNRQAPPAPAPRRPAPPPPRPGMREAGATSGSGTRHEF
jgi:hypothetical protein